VVPATRKATGNLKRRNMEKAFGFSENIMVGVDESVNSTIPAEKVPLNKQGQPYGPVADYPIEYKLSATAKNILQQMRGVTLKPEDADAIVEELGHITHGWVKKVEVPSNLPTVFHIVNGVVTPNLEILLGSVLGTIDASIPNKEQNRAVKHIIRKDFDEAYYDILRRSFPDDDFGFSGEYAIQPETSKDKAFHLATLKE
jgi:uncharacterized protein (DUF697 family)